MDDDFQTNQAFTSVPQRSSGYGRFPTYAESREGHRILWCLVQGDCKPFKVTPPLNFDIDNLKEVIHAKGIDTTKFSVLPKDLVLWKLRESEPLEPDNTFARRVSTKLSNLSEVATEPGPWKKLSVVFPQQPPQDHLHIIIQMDSQKRPSPRAAYSNDYPSKRSRGSDMVSNRRLRCVIEGESVVFTVTAGCDVEVGDLKKIIQSERALDTLKNVGAQTLELWKPNDSNPIFAKPSNNLVERIRSLGDLSNNLEPTDNLFSIFPNQPSNDHLHIIVKVPAIPKKKRNDAYGTITKTRKLPSCHRVVSGGDGRQVVVQKAISSGPSAFGQFFDADASFVDKTLAIEAFLREPGSHHLILRPRRCGKSFTLSMIGEFLKRPLQIEEPYHPDITTSPFKSTAITDPRYHELVSTHFQQYPVLYIDLKDVHGTTFEHMQTSFDRFIIQMLVHLSDAYNGSQNFVRFCQDLRDPQALPHRRDRALQDISWKLQQVFMKPVVVLIDEYDSPIHSAIEHGYANLASDFFATVFGSLLKNNQAVFASMMVGICKVAKSGWLSQLNHLKIFPMHAEDDRYAKSFLFTEEEVEILRGVHGQGLSIEALRTRYNGYAARCKPSPGLVKLYNPLSVIRALETNMLSNFWVETGKYSPLSKHLWRGGPGFRDSVDLLLTTQTNVNLVIDDNINFLTYDTIPDPALWGLLYYSGYLTIQGFGEQSSEYIFGIPNGEVTSEWHDWVVRYLKTHINHAALSGVYGVISRGDAEGFQTQFTAFLQEYLPLYCTPQHKEKVYQTLCFMLIFILFGKEYDVRMEQDAGHGRSDITANPFDPQNGLAFIFEIKAVARLSDKRKRILKTPDRMAKDLEKAKIKALKQIEERRYRARVPLHATKVHEYAFVFCGKFCAAAVRTFERNAKEGWQWVSEGTTGVSDCMGNIGEKLVDSEDEGEDEDDEDA